MAPLKLVTIRSESAGVSLSVPALIGQLPGDFAAGMGWLTFRPEVSYAAPVEKTPGYYEFVTPNRTIGPFIKDLVGDMIRLQWGRVCPSDPRRMLGNLQALKVSAPRVAQELAAWLPKPR